MNLKQYCKADKTPEALRQSINTLELKPLQRDRLLLQIESGAWEYLEEKYRNFLYLCGLTGIAIVPTKDIDMIWHAHILDTQKYHEDCDKTFGFYLHHYPYFGREGDEKEHALAFEKSKQLYEAQFGEPYEVNEAVKLIPGLAEQLEGEDHSGCA